MAFCVAECVDALPPLNTNDCATQIKPGGICQFVFLTCDVTFVDITSLVEWQAYIDDCKVRITNDLLADKPATSVTKSRISSCGPEVVTGETHTINFQSFKYDLEFFLNYAFWQTVKNNPANYQLAFFDSNGFFYGPVGRIGVEASEVIPNNEIEPANITGIVTFEGIEILVPQVIPGLQDLLLANINTTCPAP